MAELIKFVDKDFNPNRLENELEDQNVLPTGMRWAGFDRINNRLMEPFTETRVIATHTGLPDTTGDPGELHLRYPRALTPVREAKLDQVLADHDATLPSRAQANDDSDDAAVSILIGRYRNWDTLTPAQKDNVLKQLTRLVARLLDSNQDV